MKKILPLIALSMALSSCDSPRSQRTVMSSNQPATSSSSAATTTGVNFSTGSGTITATASSSTNVAEDAKHCKFSTDGINNFESSSAHIGAYTLCQSSTDKTIFYIQIKTPPVSSTGDVKICFIPHTTTGSNSIYVGNPMCGNFTDPKEVKKITFVKYTEFTNALINSVMFFKDTSYFYPAPFNGTGMTMDAYKTCMSQLAVGNSKYCDAFKNVQQYVLRSF